MGGLVVAAIAVAVFLPPADLAGRVLVTAMVSGVLATLFSDWQARTVVAVISVFLVVVVWGRGADAQPVAGSRWSYTPLVGLAVLLGVASGGSLAHGFARMGGTAVRISRPAILDSGTGWRP